MTLAELILRCREDYVDDLLEPYSWSDSFLAQSLFRSETEACRRADLLFDDSTAAITQITLASATASYAFSEKITRIDAVIYDDVPLQQKTEDEMVKENGEEWRTETGTPTEYLIKGRKIRFFPIPEAGDNGETAYLEVYRTPLSAFADPEIPEESHEDLCLYAAHLAYKRRDEDTYNPENAAIMLEEFNRAFGLPEDAETRIHRLEQPRNTTFALPSLWGPVRRRID